KSGRSLERCIDRGSQPTVHVASETGVTAQEKAAPFLLALDAGATLDDGPQRDSAGLDVEIDVPAGIERAELGQSYARVDHKPVVRILWRGIVAEMKADNGAPPRQFSEDDHSPHGPHDGRGIRTAERDVRIDVALRPFRQRVHRRFEVDRLLGA